MYATNMSSGYVILKLVFFVLLTFVGSTIFWGTKKWIESQPVKKKK